MNAEHHRDGCERVRVIEPELLWQELRSGRRTVIVDVRSSAEFHGPLGRIPGARSVPLHQLAGRCAELGSHRNESVVVVSGRGIASRNGALELEFAGFHEVQILAGGMERWVGLGFPVAFATAPPRTLP